MVTRRTFLTTVPALAAGVGLAPVPALAAPPTAPTAPPTAYLGGRAVPRLAVRQWEARRVRVAAERLARHLPTALLADLDALLRRPARDTAGLDRDRALLAAVKLEMGEARLRRLLAPDLALSTPAGRLTSRFGRWAVSRAAVTSSTGSAQGFADWFTARGVVGDERTLLAACPDHYLIRNPEPGRPELQEVAEGGARIGGVRHQLRDEPGGGFRAELAVAFPATLPRWMVTEHRWHLACEFSNWVAAYTATLGDGPVGAGS
ncbi:hypothetical protein ACIRN4_24155 [Pimelobacter simplex]|uniref:hypothetical protein n=1 Tax=Nocardioides simplex TaxID=2045 RepID=UPI00381C6F05